MRVWLFRIAAAIGVLIPVLYYWYLLDAPRAVAFAIPMDEIRRLASAVPGERAREIHVEHVGNFEAPGAIMFTGGGWSKQVMWAVSYQVVYPDHTALIDTAMNADITKEMSGSGFIPDAYDRMIQAMTAAQLIVLTHEHPDHIGGLAAHPDLARLMKTSVQVTAEQLLDPERMLPVHFPGGPYTGLQYDKLHAIAPGMVLIKAASHSPGSQMIFVQLANGAEYLFTGDVAWVRRNIDSLNGRPRLTASILHEDRAIVLGQLGALHALAQSQPKLNLVPGHDAGVVQEMIAQGRMKSGF